MSEPPSDLPPGLAGALIDEKVDTKEVIATIVDLARRGYIEMTDTKDESTFGRAETIFTRPKSFGRSQGLREEVADALFDGSHPDQVTTKQLRNHFYTHVATHRAARSTTEWSRAGLFSAQPQERAQPLARLRLPGGRRARGAHGHLRPARRRRLGLLPARLHHLGDHRLGFSPFMPQRTAGRRPGAGEVAGVPQLPARPHPVPGHGRRPRTPSRSTWPTPSPSAWRRNGCGASKV